MNKAVAFYKEIIPNQSGLYLFDILNKSDLFLEQTHDYIQWLFPNREESNYNPEAPLLDDQTIELFKSDIQLLNLVRISLRRMIKFYQLDAERPWWVTKFNHNYLRITRIINTLHEFNLTEEKNDFFEKLLIIFKNNKEIIGFKTFTYWDNAFSGLTDE